MIGKYIAKLPWKQRLLVGLPLFAVLTWLSLRLVAASMMAHVALADDSNEVGYDSSFFEWNGNVGATNLRIDHLMPDGSVGASFAADRMVVNTPGVLWLWWTALHGSKTIPSDIGVSFENFRDLSRTDSAAGNYTNLPYDQVGCGNASALLTPARLQAMGLREVRRDVSFRLHAKDDNNSTLSFGLVTHGAGELDLDLDLALARPVNWRDTLVAFQASKVTAAQLRVKDLGFVGLRNAYCAKSAGLTAQAFGDYYDRALAARLAEQGLVFNPESLAMFRQFNDRGGELLFVAKRPPTQALTTFATASLDRQIQMMPAVVSYNGGREAPFHLDRRLPGEIVPPAAAPVAAAPANSATDAPAPVAAAAPPVAPEATPAAPVAAASAPAASTAVAFSSALPPGELAYKDLKGREGAHVEVVTRNGTLRRGTLLAYSAFVSTMKLDPDQGGFVLTVPGDSVESVRPVPAAAVAGAASAPASAAPTP